jgi:aspartyl-tRNA(Asn)/glutamyl-tRNA(Gln) amidotransferase subunit A
MATVNPFSSLTDLAAALARHELSAVELADFYLARIERGNAKLHAFVTVEPDLARALARASDARRAAGLTLGPLDGLPIALKDLLEIEGRVTTVGSALWPDRRSTETAVCVERLLAAGMVVLGKTHMVEFAFGGWGPNPKVGTPWNPWDLVTHRVPGGSSSGSGVAVAAGLAPAAIGSDTGGSVRIPSSLNGITGLKTTRGLISLQGAFPLSSTLDTIGPMTRTVDDTALLTIALAEPERSAGLEHYAESDDIAGKRIVLMPADQFPITVDPDVLKALETAKHVLQSRGARVNERRLPFDMADLMRRNGALIAAEAYTVHRAYIEDEALPIGPWVRSRMLSGKGISAADYIEALAHRRAACAAWLEWMRDADALLTPTLPMGAIPLEEVDETTTPLAAFTRAANYLNAPALALPAGFTAAGLPVGVQLVGKAFDEANVLQIGRAFQTATDWHRRVPDLSALFS